MDSAIGDDPAALLALFECALGRSTTKDDAWREVKVNLHSRRIRVAAHPKDEWMTAFESLRWIIQGTKIEIEHLRELLEEACCDTSYEETSLPALIRFLDDKKIPVTAHPEDEWKMTFDHLRRIARGEKVENFEDPKHSCSRERSKSTSYQQSLTSETSDPGYHSDPARDKNGEEHFIHLVVENGEHPSRKAPLGFDTNYELEEHCIRQTVCHIYGIPGDVGDVLTLKFRKKFEGTEVVKACRVVPEDQILADVVFGKESPILDEATDDDKDFSLEHQKENCQCQEAIGSREESEPLVRCAAGGNDNLSRQSEFLMNTCAGMYKGCAQGAVGDPSKAIHVGEAIAYTYLGCKGVLGSRNPNT